MNIPMNIPMKYVFHNFCLSRSVDIEGGSSYPPAQVPPLSPIYSVCVCVCECFLL